MHESAIIGTTMLALALVFTSIVFMIVYFRYRARADAQATIRTALEKGQPLTPELLAQLMDPLARRVDRRQVDLRRGVIATALGAGIGVIGAVGAPMWQQGVAIGALPFLIGIAYIALWKLGPQG